MWPFGKRIESVFRSFYFLVAKALIINYESRVRGQINSYNILKISKLQISWKNNFLFFREKNNYLNINGLRFKGIVKTTVLRALFYPISTL